MLGVALLGAGLAGGPAASAEPSEASIELPTPGGPGWEPVSFPSISRHTTYTGVEEDGRSVLRAESECSASGLAYSLRGTDLSATPILAWRWRGLARPLAADERSRAGDDFAARLALLFEVPRDRLSFAERARHRIGRLLFGSELPNRSFGYVFAGSVERGRHWPSAYDEKVTWIALRGRDAPLGVWFREVVDWAQERKRWLPEADPTPIGVALMTDSDNGCTHASAEYGRLRFERRATASPPTEGRNRPGI